MSKKKTLLFLMDFIIVAVLLVFDQYTKWLAVTKLKNNPPFVLIEGVLEFDYLENYGVAFGMLQGQRILILISGIVLMTLMMYLIVRLPEGKKFAVLHIILSCIIAGGIGNIIDRAMLGYVVDFISFVLINYPIFNVADCYVVCATIALVIMFVFFMKEEDFEFLSFKKKSKEN